MAFFEYGQVEIEYLKGRDKRLGKAIESLGKIEREIIPDLFESLIRQIVAQQISGKAAETIWRRLCEKLSEIKPYKIANASVSDIQRCGLTTRKAGYIKEISKMAIGGDLDLSAISKMSDSEVIIRLSSLPGVGVWTAEMILIFSLCRPDVVSWGDLAIRRGIMNLYGLRSLTKERFGYYRRRYSPHGSVASLYLWAWAAR